MEVEFLRDGKTRVIEFDDSPESLKWHINFLFKENARLESELYNSKWNQDDYLTLQKDNKVLSVKVNRLYRSRLMMKQYFSIKLKIFLEMYKFKILNNLSKKTIANECGVTERQIASVMVFLKCKPVDFIKVAYWVASYRATKGMIIKERS